jgi:solute carrier family 25 carnitine/acylcarnitine transporter 20/29
MPGRAHNKQASPLIGIAAVNSLLFTAYGASRRLVSPYPDLTVPQVALAGSMAGAANAVLASPVCQLGPAANWRLMR